MTHNGVVAAGGHLTDWVSLGVLASAVPRDAVDEAVAAAGRAARRSDGKLPPHVMVYFAMALALFAEEDYEEVAARLTETLASWGCWDESWSTPTSGGITQARQRLGPEPLELLYDKVVGPVAGMLTRGAFLRLIPVSGRFFAAVAAYLDAERPPGTWTDLVFVVLKGPRRGQPLSAKGMDEVLAAARRRTGLGHATCHELRHTCLTRLREAGMALEAVQAQAGHASIESTRIYLHLADDWLAAQYRKAAEVIDAQVFAGQPAGPGAGTGSWR